jgi:hypothetical protein
VMASQIATATTPAIKLLRTAAPFSVLFGMQTRCHKPQTEQNPRPSEPEVHKQREAPHHRASDGGRVMLFRGGEERRPGRDATCLFSPPSVVAHTHVTPAIAQMSACSPRSPRSWQV